MNHIRILFVGDLNEYGRSFQRSEMLKELGHNVYALSHVPVPFFGGRDKPPLFSRILWKLKLPYDATGINRKIRNEIKTQHFNLVWIENGVTVHPGTLKYIKKYAKDASLISVSEDDMYAKHNRSKYYEWGLKYYDVVFTTKTYNLLELKSLGAKRTALFLDSYNEHVHKPTQLTNAERERFSNNVSAIGAFEEERAQSLLYLAERGIKVAVWGSGWGAWANRHENLLVKNEFLFGADYTKAICATKINLNFLRKVNRDEVTSRSVEIPASGGFMLSERTKRHLEFFVEGKEAEFFDSNEEMLKKVNYYLTHEDERVRIATAGKERCLVSGYSMRVQLEQILEKALRGA